MELVQTSSFIQLTDILLGDTAASHQNDATSSLTVEFCEQFGSLNGLGLLP